jgi:hypothetical protein
MSNAAMTVLVFLLCAAVGAGALAPALRWSRPPRPTLTTGPHPVNTVAIGTVQSVADLVVVEVESVTGQRFVGRLRHQENDPSTATLRPGVVLLVAFNPDAREQLSLADDMDVARAAFDQMLVRKGLVTRDQLDLIRHGTKARGVVTAMHPTGTAREDHREVELDLMVRRPDGGQFPAHQRTLIPETALEHVAPGSLIDTYYRRGDESAVAVCVSPG